MKEAYIDLINSADSLDRLDYIAETASADSRITNSEYADIISHGIRKAQSWCPVMA